MSAPHLRTVALLGTTQTLAWASSYYLPAILAKPIARELGVSVPTVFAAFSLALIVSALIGPFAGRSIDRWGGRPVLMTTNIVFALGLATLSLANGPLGLFAAWIVLGIAMGSGLYESAFSALVHLYGTNSRKAITGITLIAGFASTVGWPLTTLLEVQFGWRNTCLAWAGFHLIIGVPLNALLPTAAQRTPSTNARVNQEEALGNKLPRSRRAGPLLAFVFACAWFVSTAMAAHLPGLLQAAGASLTVAVAAGALLGPAQVGARMFEYGLLRRWHPLISARIATLMHPIGAVVLAFFGAPAAAVFTVMHGAGNGVLTIANGTLPLALFGPRGYGARQGLLMVPARVVQASAPWVFGLVLDRWGANALWLTASTVLAAFVALLFLPRTADIPSRQS
ncbi:MAG: MFS transporter [Burkholderiaceae bacterium]|nr:MFS transporter [Burkholderiaceae bacterium]